MKQQILYVARQRLDQPLESVSRYRWPIELVICPARIAWGGAQYANQFLRNKEVIVEGYSITDGRSMYPITKSLGTSAAVEALAIAASPDGESP